MKTNYFDNNKITVMGQIVEDLTYSHSLFGENFYKTLIKVPRLSENYDLLPVIISDRLIQNINFDKNIKVLLKGQLRSYNKRIDNKSKLILLIFAKDLYLMEEDQVTNNPNIIFLEGYLCKQPIYRKTPFGREIADLLVAVNRMYHKSDYIPCIAWGRNARYSRYLDVGDHIKVWGRVQSREYQKRLTDGSIENRTAYEVSISRMSRLEEEESE